MSLRRRRAAAIAGSLAAAIFAQQGDAHLRFPKVKGERLIELRLAEDPIRLGYRVGFGDSLAAQIRSRADRDGDTQVSAAEGNAALDARSAEVLAALVICTGRTPDTTTCRHFSARDIERVEAEGWVPSQSGHLHFAWTLRLKERANEIGAIRLEDAYEVPGIELTDVEISAPPHTPLLRAGDGAVASGVAQRFTWIERVREPGPRIVVASYAPPKPTRKRFLLAAGLLALAGAMAWVFLRQRRPRREN